MAETLVTPPTPVEVDETGKPVVSTPPSLPLPSDVNSPTYEPVEEPEPVPYVNPMAPSEPIEQTPEGQ